ncbi:hypothetical protein BUALT_Bualt06G0028100 [Buddleja alternifolia]|uniref:Transposase-associated domain-containing protein n=1 Tax=Buddleja alternifolia TaxID=168488 RepID=A0AAV6XN44_9LAMI|nr:hypothetical protein BUALT_Bualt06G0028100 [Buddleja alternifolia]
MDKSWMRKPRSTKEYERGLNQFLDTTFDRVSLSGKIYCPCKRCKNVKWINREVAKEHLTVDGFMKGYTNWIAHGEDSSPNQVNFQQNNEFNQLDDMYGLIHDAFGVNEIDVNMEEELNEQAKNFYKLLEDNQQKLYRGCKQFSKLAFLIRLFHLKCTGKWSNKTFTVLLELLKEAFPDAINSLPKSYYEVQKIIGALGLTCIKTNACSNDRMLYWKERVNDEFCHVCNTSRYVQAENSIDEEDSSSKFKRFPAKIEGMHLNGSQVSHELRALARGPNPVGKRYRGFIIMAPKTRGRSNNTSSERISEKNKQTRAQLDLLHCMGKKSFALVKEIMEFFYFNSEQMKLVTNQEHKNSNGDYFPSPNDTHAKIMGEDKHGHLRMYGLGVTPVDVHRAVSSCDANYRMAMEYKSKYFHAMEKYDALHEKLENLSAIVHGRTEPDPQNVLVVSPNNQPSSGSTSRPMRIG